MKTSYLKEYSTRVCNLYDTYEKYKHARSGRKRKELLNKTFKFWYKCPSPQLVYDNSFWGYPTDFGKDTTFREFFWKEVKGLRFNNTEKLLHEMFDRVNNTIEKGKSK